MSVLGGIFKLAVALITLTAGGKVGKDGVKNIKDELSSNKK